MSEYHEIQYSLMLNAEMTYGELRKVEITMIRILSYIKRFCGDENIDKAIKKIEAVIMACRAAQIAIRALEAAEGPIGWAYAATTTVGAVIMGVTAVETLGS
jgi:hypothetical protein